MMKDALPPDPPLVHPCIEDGCDEEGMIGEGVFLRKGKFGEWRCWRHDKALQAERAAYAASPAAQRDPRQGALGL